MTATRGDRRGAYKWSQGGEGEGDSVQQYSLDSGVEKLRIGCQDEDGWIHKLAADSNQGPDEVCDGGGSIWIGGEKKDQNLYGGRSGGKSARKRGGKKGT